MLDGFARSITYLRISITDRCNYRCRYCMPDGGIEKCAHEDRKCQVFNAKKVEIFL